MVWQNAPCLGWLVARRTLPKAGGKPIALAVFLSLMTWQKSSEEIACRQPFQSPFLTHLENNLKDVGTQLAIWRIMHEAMCRNRRAGFTNMEASETYQEVRRHPRPTVGHVLMKSRDLLLCSVSPNSRASSSTLRQVLDRLVKPFLPVRCQCVERIEVGYFNKWTNAVQFCTN